MIEIKNYTKFKVLKPEVFFKGNKVIGNQPLWLNTAMPKPHLCTTQGFGKGLYSGSVASCWFGYDVENQVLKVNCTTYEGMCGLHFNERTIETEKDQLNDSEIECINYVFNRLRELADQGIIQLDEKSKVNEKAIPEKAGAKEYKVDGKYMVNLFNFEHWGGTMFDSEEEAVEAARQALKDQDLENNIFGYKLGDYKRLFRYDPFALTYFDLGIVSQPETPKDMAQRLIDLLDDTDWGEHWFEDVAPSEYIFSESDIKELNNHLEEWINKKLLASRYYTVKPIGKVLVNADED